MQPIMLIYAPVGTRSGYGDQSREIIRHLISLNTYDIKIISCAWGATPLNALHGDNPADIPIIERICAAPLQLPRQPEIYLHIGVPNEAQPQGKFNILVTAGIETTLCSPEWIMGMNRMDLILTTSEHSKRVLSSTVVEQRDQNGNVAGPPIKLEKPIEVLHNCMNTDIFKPTNEMPQLINDLFNNVSESFCYLFVGHWLKGGLGEDRKNVGLLVKTFLETFKGYDAKRRPALILKTSGAGFSILDQEEIVDKIKQIKSLVGGTNLPNVYVLHGDLTEHEMNALYNNPKVKAHVSFTKGEGFGLPLLQATQSKKPIIASGWSGQLDFLNKDDAFLIGGQLRNVEPGAVWEGVILPQSQWFNIDVESAKRAMVHAYKNNIQCSIGAQRLSGKCKKSFSIEANREQLAAIFDKYVPKFAVPVPMKLPTLKKLNING